MSAKTKIKKTKKNIIDVELTAKQKKFLKLTGGVGFKLNNKWPYVPVSYRAKDNNGEYMIDKKFWPVFTIRGIDGVESSELEDECSTERHVDPEGNSTYKIQSGKSRMLSIRSGIVTWENFLDETFENFVPPPKKDPVEEDMITEDSLRQVSFDLQIDLYNAITRRSTLTDEELLGLG